VGAVANDGDADVVHAVLEAYPDGIYWKNGSRAQTLLHFAACHSGRSHSPKAVVKVLLDAWPEAAHQVDEDQNTALHLAAAQQAPPDVVQALIDAFPGACQMRGSMNRLPLSLALLCEAPPDSIRAISDAYPGALRDQCMVADYRNHGHGVA
jgi:ankyrin repeat protein